MSRNKIMVDRGRQESSSRRLRDNRPPWQTINGLNRPISGLNKPISGFNRPINGLNRPVSGLNRPTLLSQRLPSTATLIRNRPHLTPKEVKAWVGGSSRSRTASSEIASCTFTLLSWILSMYVLPFDDIGDWVHSRERESGCFIFNSTTLAKVQ